MSGSRSGLGVRVRVRVRVSLAAHHRLPEGLELFGAEGRLEGMLVEDAAAQLQLDDLLPVETLLDALGDQAVDVHRPVLAVAVGPVHRLQVVRRVPVGIEDDDARRRGEIEAEAAW